ncbi:MAG TPA: vWA domain-containing protein [Pyrinomonadaceae bacterium]
MRKLVFRIGAAMFTFFVGIGLATALVVRSDSPTISPIDISAQPTTAGQMLEMVFVLDTTSSMTGLIDGAKQRIWGIVNDVMQSPSHPNVRIGLVGYRDRGDAYVTTVLPLTSDLDKVYSTLMNYQAAGGGDAPEDVRRALADGVRSVGWSKGSSGLAQILFLVGDAPPHDDYQDEPDTAVTTADAVQRGIIINTIQCGDMPGTREVWQAISRIGLGQYFSIAQDGGVQTIATPYDEQLGTLATKLGSTYVAYGFGGGAEGEKKRAQASEDAVHVEASVATSAPAVAKAERAVNKAVNANAYVGDLLQSLENGSLKLDSIKEEDLPADLRKLPAAERKVQIEKRLAERKGIRAQIMTLSKQRDEFIVAETKKRSGGKQSSFDTAVAVALKEQLARRGIK